MNRRTFLTAASAAALSAGGGCLGSSYDFELLNVSYDPTRELYRRMNRLFAEHYAAQTGKRVRVRQSHGGSGSQARSVTDGIQADVVTLAMWADINNIRSKKLIADNWESRLPNNSLPYYSTIVFTVRKGNPHGIEQWSDLVDKPGVKIITANPKTGGGAKLNLLGAWLAVRHDGGSVSDARKFITEMYRRVPVLDTGARGATVTFARKNIGDVHLTWENEAWLEKRELKDEIEIVYPKVSIRAEPHVALVDANVDLKGTRAPAEEYLRFLYTNAAQELIAETFFRPGNADVAARHAGRFPPIELIRATASGLGGWNKIQTDFFSEGGLFDQIYQSAR
ncbi:sulfate ABC transporter substrate-binding protein [Gemmata sp. JC717]|uniref:Sulfate ABC transporter substrate-binding protein n=1 Tax=Gemmata algarum TaxID=2975278 RepID=A0ABU5EXS9_9BACT|nr:sulfate ABC transporter substrate-binding protein [Gemmata algarum]MDY3551073.1 sulfate ABC transporter substrate-binding protein [Gemmata algarum]MDY3559940.1 sulfate ABC transporter substrate-binding protein [Gemmata algarum]